LSILTKLGLNGEVMKYLISAALLVVVMAGCDGVGVGNRRALLVTPEEKELVLDARKLKAGEEVKGTPRGLLRPMSVNKDVAVDEESVAEETIEPAWKFKWSWDKGIATPGKPSADNPDYDDEGNLIVKPEIVRAFKLPDIHSGVLYDFTEDHLRAVLEVEIADFKTPVLGKMSTGLLAGEQYLGLHISKQIIPIFEIEAGLAFGRDFDTDNNTIGCDFLIIKF